LLTLLVGAAVGDKVVDATVGGKVGTTNISDIVGDSVEITGILVGGSVSTPGVGSLLATITGVGASVVIADVGATERLFVGTVAGTVVGAFITIDKVGATVAIPSVGLPVPVAGVGESVAIDGVGASVPIAGVGEAVPISGGVGTVVTTVVLGVAVTTGRAVGPKVGDPAGAVGCNVGGLVSIGLGVGKLVGAVVISGLRVGV